MSLVIVALLVKFSWAGTCAKYTCKTPDLKEPIDSSTCGFFYEAQNVWYLKPCTKGYYCAWPESMTVPTNVMCEWSPPAPPSAYPGEPCIYDSDCQESLGCSKGVCEGVAAGGVCTSPLQCAPGLTCISSRCELQSKKGGDCFSEFDCPNNCGCDTENSSTEGKCVEYFSVSVGDEVQSCPGSTAVSSISFINLLCESATCIKDPTEDKAVCADALMSTDKLPVNCTQSTQCTASNAPEGVIVNSECAPCGYNLKQYTYCSLFTGDPLFTKLLAQVQKWVNSDEIMNCNSENRFGCMANMKWSGYEKLQYYNLTVETYPQVAGAESCVPQVFFPSLYEVQQNNLAVYALETAFYLLSF